MGHHFVPQEYLRAFAAEPDSGLIFVYDKLNLGGFKQIPIKVVAQARDFYEEDVERQLAEIEGPAHAALTRLHAQRTIRPEDRDVIAFYLAVMMYRGPRRRRKGAEIIPDALEQTLREAESDIEAWAITRAVDDPIVAARRAELEAVASAFRVEPPKAVIDALRRPWPSQNVFAIVVQKCWRLLRSTCAETFVTTDSPAFFFEGLGLGSLDSEFTFPLSPTLALVGDWQGPRSSLTVYDVGSNMVRETNRRVIAGCERFVYSHAPQPWIPIVAGKSHPYLSRIDWSGRFNRR